jgi:hypothetical protein
MEQISLLEKKGFNFTTMVADTGGGGKMYVEQVQKVQQRAFTPAKKTDKYDHTRLLNDDLRTGHVVLQQGSVYAQEIAELPKDPDWPDPEKPEKPPTEDGRFANHCCDAGLYSFREAMHWLHQDEAPVIKKGTPGWFKQTEDATIRKLESKRSRDGDTWLDKYDQQGHDFLEDE